MLEIDAVLDAPPPLRVGERTSLRIIVRNAARADSTPAQLTIAGSLSLRLIGEPAAPPPSGAQARRPRRDDRECKFAVPALFGGEKRTFEIDLYPLAADPEAGIIVRIGGAHPRELVLRPGVVAAPAFEPQANDLAFGIDEAAAGAAVAGRVVVTNTGRAAAEGCLLRVGGDLEQVSVAGTLGTLEAGERRIVPVTARIPAPIADGTPLRATASLLCDGEVFAIGETCIVARSSARFDPAASLLAVDAARIEPNGEANLSITVRNCGDDDAHDACVEIALPAWLTAERALPLRIDRLEAGASISLATRVRAIARESAAGAIEATIVARNAAPLELRAVPVEVRIEPRFEISIAPEPAANVRAGALLRWQVRVANVGDGVAAEMRIGLACEGGVYVPGTTAIEEAELLDAGGTSPLWSPSGLAVEGLAPRGTIALTCSTLADSEAGHVALRARIVYEGSETIAESAPVPVAAVERVPFVAGFAIREAAFCGVPSRAPRDVRATYLDIAVVRHLGELHGLTRHLWALGVLCADRAGDVERTARLGTIRSSLRSVFDRLSIKLRMPNYRVATDDVLDPAACEALTAVDGAGEGAGSLAGRLMLAVGLAAAPEGDPLADAALGGYRAVFTEMLRESGDAEVIAALPVAQPVLDEALDAILACEAHAVLA